MGHALLLGLGVAADVAQIATSLVGLAALLYGAVRARPGGTDRR